MPRNITVYISDEIDQKMKQFGEVNWSEIARQGIEQYMDKRVVEAAIKDRVPDNVFNEFRFYLESLQNYMNNAYTYSIASLHNDFNVGVTPREKRQFQELFNHLVEDYRELCRSFDLFQQKRKIDQFQPIFIKLMRIVERHSTMVREFAELVKEKIEKIELLDKTPSSRAPHEYLDENYAIFREKYNSLIMSYVKFVFVTKDLHQQHIEDYKSYQLLAPRLVGFRLSTKKVE